MPDSTPAPALPADSDGNRARKKRVRASTDGLPKRPAHRPTKLTAALQQQILTCMAMGMTRTDACKFAGLSRSAFHEWMTIGEHKPKGHSLREFHDAVESAFEKFKARHLQTLNKAAKDDPQWSAWLLTHTPGTKELYASQQKMQHEGALTVQLEDIDALARRMAENVRDDVDD